jgi:SynChlorMet cassette protein ScmD
VITIEEGKETTLKNDNKPLANPFVVLREEFDDWAILFDPDNGHGFGLNPTSVYVWKFLDGEHSIDEMLNALRRDALDVPQEAGEHLFAFVEELTEHGLAGYGGKRTQNDMGHPRPHRTGAFDLAPADEKESLARHSPPNKPLVYAKPGLVSFSDAERAVGKCHTGAGDASCNMGSHATGNCNTLGYSAGTCNTGNGT